MQRDQVEERPHDLVFEAHPGSVSAIPAVEYQLLKVDQAILVPPKQLDPLGDVFVVSADEGYFLFNSAVWVALRQGSPVGQLILRGVIQLRKIRERNVGHGLLQMGSAKKVRQ
jgi:hypothetical protein